MRIYLVAILSIYFLCFTTSTTAQIPTAKSSRALPTEVENSENRVSQIILTAEEHFKQGKHRLKLNQREKARQEFDRAIDSIIESGFDVRTNERLETFYLELVERIYREEIPLGKPVSNDGPKNVSGFRDQSFVANRNDELSKPIASQAKSFVPLRIRSHLRVSNANICLLLKNIRQVWRDCSAFMNATFVRPRNASHQRSNSTQTG